MQVNISGCMQNKLVSVQNGTVLYEKADSVLVPEGLHLAELIDIRRFGNVFGDRVGLVFRISAGRYVGQEIMESAIVADILKMRGAGASLAEIANNLNAKGIEGKRGGKWFPSTVRYLIQRQAA